ncbi:General stress protein 39 [Rhodobacteraceae bacterium THAF1]|uniref:SDR family oxidoreductase n=1 Tax=Palleronia sp. THAF1 TaxID=2587842 RepID=UPI000F3E9410|nr:SDR family oxidoreductase [Palleronia sp. THAF1]QFU09936.1 General stress protein 39 [Palleronia sp. THAF1]VDC17161.1 General stress protein 39 [Rhodobacteraceae bacterium THAF1]
MATDPKIPPQTQDTMPGRESEMTPAPDWKPRFPGVGKMKDKIVLITGGDSGIGRATAALFAREGAKIAIAYRSETGDAQDTKKIVEDEGSECLTLEGDLGNRTHADDVVKKVVDHYGQLDTLVINHAQQYLDSPIDEKLSDEMLDDMISSNIKSYFYVMQAALPHLEEGASVVITNSVNAFQGNDSLIGYSTTRGASLAFMRSMASALTAKGIRVNGVAPGPIWTPFIPGTMPADMVEDFGSSTPMGRCGQPWEVATAFLFLAGPDGSYFSGQTLHPNGGMIVGA